MHSGRNICLSESSDVFFMTPSSAIVYANRSWGGCGEKEQRIGCMCKLWMEQMGFMKITVGRINRTDDSRCQSIHANTF